MKNRMSQDIELLIGDWAVEIDDVYGDSVNSMHEGLALSEEELTEFLAEIECENVGMNALFAKFKNHVFSDDFERMIPTLKQLEKRSIKAMGELIQFICLVQKCYLTLEREREQEKKK